MGIAVSHSTHIFFHISALSAQSWLSEIERCEQIRSQPTISAPFLLVCPSVREFECARVTNNYLVSRI